MALEVQLLAVDQRERARPQTSLTYRLPADISFDGNFQEGEIRVEDGALRYFVAGRLHAEYPLEELTELKATGLVGSGQLTAQVQGTERVLARFATEHLPLYTALARIVNRFNTGEAGLDVPLPEVPACPTCGRRFQDSSRVCPNCLNKSAVLRRLWTYAKPHAPLLFTTAGLFWVLTGLRLVGPQLQRLLIDNVLIPRNPALGTLVLYVGLMALVGAGTYVCSVVRGRTMVLLSGRLSRDLRALVYAKIQELSLNYIARRKTGDLMNRVSSDTDTLQRFIQGQAAMGINEALVLIGITVILFAYSWQLALLILFPAPIVVFLAMKVRGRIHSMYRRQWRAFDRVNSLLQDILSGIRVVKAFGREAREVERFTESAQQMADITAYNERMWNTLFPALGFIMGIGNFVVLYYGGHLVLGERMQLGELVQFSAYAGMLYGPLQFMSFFPRWFTQAMTATERIFEVIDVEPDVKDSAAPRDHVIEGHVRLENVTFGYEKHEPVLQDVSLEIRQGEMIGLVGHSGAGKSTLINLVSRFYDVDEGRILIDGIDIRDISQQFFRSQIGVVLQETFLFSGTVYENIAYAKPDAPPDEIIRAAKVANAHDFIMKFTDAYDTLVGERGQRLSGGERQRIAIARAILHNPRILILDEATASVDTETEYQIQEALGRLIKGRTTIAIAHRLSTLRNADRLVVLDKGRVAELGSHAELMAQEGIYHGLVTAQREMSRIKGVDG